MIHNVHIEVTVSGQIVRFCLLMAAFLSVPLELGSETISLSTTYPSPVGIYNRLITTGNTGGATNNTILSRDQADVILTPTSNPGGHTYIGTTQAPVPAGINNERLVVGEPGHTANMSMNGFIFFRSNLGCTQYNSGGATLLACPGTDPTCYDTCPANQYATWTPGIYQIGQSYQNNPESYGAIDLSGNLNITFLIENAQDVARAFGPGQWTFTSVANQNISFFCCPQ